MRQLATTVLIMALFIIMAQPAEAQRQGQSETGLQSVDDGSFHPDPLDPADGTILGTFAPTPNAPAGAEGRVIVNYLKTQGVARVNVDVKGLEPGTTYEVLMIDHQPGDAGEIFSLTDDLEVDEDGNGSINVVWFEPFPFNAVNVRLPREWGSARLSTIGTSGGIQQQTPSNRGGNRGGGGR